MSKSLSKEGRSAALSHRLAGLGGLILSLLTAAGMVGCASYRPLPLPDTAPVPQRIADLRGGAQPGTPLDLPALEKLVLLNNPDLQTARIRHQAAQAQRRQKGVLPNPVLSGLAGFLFSGAGDATAWSAGISQDVRALITLKPRRESARLDAASVDASLLWEEWLTVAKTRLVVVDLVQEQRLQGLDQQLLDLLQHRDRQQQDSLGQGTVDLNQTAPLLAASSDLRQLLADRQRQILGLQQSLNGLLGLAAQARVALPANLPLPPFDAATITPQLDSVTRRRPDLVALQLGYQAQEARLHAAVLSQFPMFSLGYASSQDNSRVLNGGPSINMELPVFDRQQHAIAIEQASREQLRQEYRNRLAEAQQTVLAVIQQNQLLRRQLDDAYRRLPGALQRAEQANLAWQQGLLNIQAYVDLLTAAHHEQATVISLEQQALQQQVALDSLLGTGMPCVLPKDVIPS